MSKGFFAVQTAGTVLLLVGYNFSQPADVGKLQGMDDEKREIGKR